MAAPLVSILLPVRRWQRYLVPAVSSLLGQTHGHHEILLIGHDDVRQLAHRLPFDTRIRPIPRREPGIVGALNTGLALARGAFIARMDDDDLSLPQRLACQLEYLRCRPDVGLCGARVEVFSDELPVRPGNSLYMHWLNNLVDPESIASDCLIECPLPHPSFMAHRDVWHRLGPYRYFDGPEDYDMVLRAWRSGIAMGKPEPVLLRWREHADRLTWSDPRYRREAFIQLKAETIAHPRSPFGLAQGRAVWLCGTGRNARRWCDALSALGIEVLGFVDLERTGSRIRKRHRPVITYRTLWRESREHLILSALGQPAARETLRDWFEHRGLRPGIDYLLGA